MSSRRGLTFLLQPHQVGASLQGFLSPCWCCLVMASVASRAAMACSHSWRRRLAPAGSWAISPFRRLPIGNNPRCRRSERRRLLSWGIGQKKAVSFQERGLQQSASETALRVIWPRFPWASRRR